LHVARRLGGSRLAYGFAGAASNGVQIFSYPFFGWLADKFSRRTILLVGHVIMVLGGVLYGAAGSVGRGQTAITMVVVARMLIGLAGGAGSAAQSYITTRSPPEERTYNLGMANAVLRVGTFCGPVFNYVVVSLPTGTAAGVLFTKYTWVGYFISVTAAMYVLLIWAVLKPDAPTTAANRNLISPADAKKQILRSRAWIMYHVGFINNFQGAVLSYFLPYYCLQQWGLGQVSHQAPRAASAPAQTANCKLPQGTAQSPDHARRCSQVEISYIFAINGGFAFLGAVAGSKMSKIKWERTILAVFQTGNTVTIGAMALFFIALPDNSASASADGHLGAIVLMVTLCAAQMFTGVAQTPGVQGCYTNLVGKQGQGLFQSLFLASTALGRTAGAQWVGIALDSMSTTQLWTLAYCNFLLLWLSFVS